MAGCRSVAAGRPGRLQHRTASPRPAQAHPRLARCAKPCQAFDLDPQQELHQVENTIAVQNVLAWRVLNLERLHGARESAEGTAELRLACEDLDAQQHCLAPRCHRRLHEHLDPPARQRRILQRGTQRSRLPRTASLTPCLQKPRRRSSRLLLSQLRVLRPSRAFAPRARSPRWLHA